MRGASAALVIGFALGGCDTDWVLPDAVPDADDAADSGPDATAADAGVDVESGADAPVIPPCTSDFNCRQQVTRVHCDTQSGLCVECVLDDQCTVSGLPRCSPLRRCVECFVDLDDGGAIGCDPGQLCQLPSYNCVFSCADAAKCPPSAPLCNGGSRSVCVNCLGDPDCADAAGGKFCDTNSGTCREVTSTIPTEDDGGVLDSSDAATEAGRDAAAPGDAMDGNK